MHVLSLVPRPVRAIRVTRGGLEPSAIATSLTGDVTSEIAEDDWERGWHVLVSSPPVIFLVTFAAKDQVPRIWKPAPYWSI